MKKKDLKFKINKFYSSNNKPRKKKRKENIYVKQKKKKRYTGSEVEAYLKIDRISQLNSWPQRV